MGKGDDFERECCRYLSRWWSDGERDDIFWRNRRRITSQVKSAERQLGDIKAERPEGIPLTDFYNIEIKIGYAKNKTGKKFKISNWDVLDLIDSTKLKGRKIFWDFWEQVVTDSEISKRTPMLIFCRDYHVPVIAMYSSDLIKLLDLQGAYSFDFISLSFKKYPTIKLMRRDDFFTWLSPRTVRVLFNQLKGGN